VQEGRDASAACCGRPGPSSFAPIGSTSHRPSYEPAEPALAETHRTLIELRDKVYAHTDTDGGRDASLTVETPSPVELPGRADFMRREEWRPLAREALPTILELCRVQGARFSEDAGRIHLAFEGP